MLCCWSGWLRSVTRRSLVLICAALAFCSSSSAHGQTATHADATFRITGRVERPLVMREGDLQVLPHKHLTVTDDKGARVKYDGVPVVELLRRAGVPLGRQLRGAGMKLYVVVEDRKHGLSYRATKQMLNIGDHLKLIQITLSRERSVVSPA
jgi:hypothetical protein